MAPSGQIFLAIMFCPSYLAPCLRSQPTMLVPRQKASLALHVVKTPRKLPNDPATTWRRSSNSLLLCFFAAIIYGRWILVKAIENYDQRTVVCSSSSSMWLWNTPTPAWACIFQPTVQMHSIDPSCMHAGHAHGRSTCTSAHMHMYVM